MACMSQGFRDVSLRRDGLVYTCRDSVVSLLRALIDFRGLWNRLALQQGLRSGVYNKAPDG